MSAARAPKAPAQKTRNKGSTSAHCSAPSSNDEESDESSAEDKSTPQPTQHPPQMQSRPQSAARSRYASVPPAADRNNPASSKDQLNLLVFSPEPTPLHPQHSLGENWALDDVSMSGPQSGAQSRESTTAPSDTRGAHESAHKAGAPRARGPVSFSPADIAEALDIAAQWFNARVPPREDNISAWESVRSMQTSINRMVTNIRRTDWNHAISMANDEDADQTVPSPLARARSAQHHHFSSPRRAP
ncbi:hypothetical protein H1R20_g403, partial [Candolleomyces eurysporus]